MNVANFASSCSDIGTIDTQDERYREVLSHIAQSRSGPFLDAGIRVRMTLPDSSVIYIDGAGGVIKAASQVKLDKDDFLKVKEVFNEIARQKGIAGVD